MCGLRPRLAGVLRHGRGAPCSGAPWRDGSPGSASRSTSLLSGPLPRAPLRARKGNMIGGWKPSLDGLGWRPCHLHHHPQTTPSVYFLHKYTVPTSRQGSRCPFLWTFFLSCQSQGIACLLPRLRGNTGDSLGHQPAAQKSRQHFTPLFSVGVDKLWKPRRQEHSCEDVEGNRRR